MVLFNRRTHDHINSRVNAMTFDETVLDYANKAQSKILEFTDVIQEQLATGHESPTELDHAIELLDFHESLLCDTNPWSEVDTLYWIEYFIVKYNIFYIIKVALKFHQNM